MLARCARCQGTFTTERYGRQTCPHCGSELILPDPSAPQQPAAGPQAAPPPQDGGPVWGPPPTPPQAGAGAPPPPPPAGGMPPPPPPGGGWAPLPPGPPPAPQGELAAPFAEMAKHGGFFRAYFQTWKLAATEPQKFFSRVRVDQVGSAVGFGLLSLVGLLVGGLLAFPLQAAQMEQFRKSIEMQPEEVRQVLEKLAFMFDSSFRVGVIGINLATTVATFFVAGLVVHLMLVMFQGATRGLGATFTVMGYSYGVYLLGAIPSCGSAIALVWQVVLLIIGLAAVHRCSTGKAAAAVFVPVVLCCCGICVCSSVFGAAIANAIGQGGSGTSTL